jgi:hypothetical protein
MDEQLDLFYEARKIELPRQEHISRTTVTDVDMETMTNVVAILEGVLDRAHPSRQMLLRQAIAALRQYARADRMRA